MQNQDLFATWGGAVINPLADLWNRFLIFLPNLLGAIIIFLIGWIVAAGLDRLVTQLLKSIKIDSALNKAGTKTFFEKSGINMEVSEIIGNLVRWTVLLIAFLGASDALRLEQVSSFLDSILGYIPQVFVAIAILLIGFLAAHFFSSIVRGTVGAARVGTAKLLASVTKWVIYVFTIGIAVQQLGIASIIINYFFMALFFMLAIAGGLAFGLGGQKAAAEALEDLKKEIGSKK